MSDAGYDAGHGEPTQAAAEGNGISTILIDTLILSFFFAGVVLTAIDLVMLLTSGAAAIVLGVIIAIIISVVIQVIDFTEDGAVSTLCEKAVWDTDGLANATSVGRWDPSWTPGSSTQQAEQPLFDGLADIASAPLSTTGFLFTCLATAIGGAAGWSIGPALGMGLSIAALYLTRFAKTYPSDGEGAFVVSEILDVASLYVDLKSIAGLGNLNAGGKVLTGMSITLDAATFYADTT
jgi:hypothetical protein